MVGIRGINERDEDKSQLKYWLESVQVIQLLTLCKHVPGGERLFHRKTSSAYRNTKETGNDKKIEK